MSENGISYIVASKDTDRLNRFTGATLTLRECDELIVENKESIAKAYNAGIEKAKNKIKCFIQDDIEILNMDILRSEILEVIDKYGIIGVIGTKDKNTFPWWENKSVCCGNVLDKRIGVVDFGQGDCECSLLDGLLLATSKDIKFDENYVGFHLYDMDICQQMISSGFKNFCIKNGSALLKHHTDGPLDTLALGESWNFNVKLYEEKWLNKKISDHTVDIIIPTFDNVQYISPCVNSILAHTQSRENLRIIVVNNGSREIENYLTKHPLIKIVHADKNLGWEGGLKLGLEHSTAPIVCFMNDDTYIPYSSNLWMNICLSKFNDPLVAAVGPTTNLCRGYQNIFLDQFGGYHSPYTSLLIFFCVFVRRSHLDEVGGVDDTLPGGDDLDLCIRFTKAGKKLVIARDTFVFHHGFKTGERVKGSPTRPGGWNSQEMVENTNKALINKHGFSYFLQCNNGGLENPKNTITPSREEEGSVVSKLVKGEIVYDLGCGASKTVPNAIGIDRIKLGEIIPNLEQVKSVADIQADVMEELPIPDGIADTIIARHILEHCVDTVKSLTHWIKKLKSDGRLIITVPNENVSMTIPMNPEHVHAFTPDSLKSVMDLLGMKEVERKTDYNGVSFTSVYERKNQIIFNGVIDNILEEKGEELCRKEA